MIKGSLQKKNNKYYAVFRKDGKQKWVSLNISAQKGNKRKAEEELKRVLTEYESQFVCDMLFTDLLSEWLSNMKDSIKPATYETYSITVNSTIIPYFKTKKYALSDLNAEIFNEYFKFLKLHGGRNKKGLAKKSVKNIRGILSAALNYACDKNLITDNPVLESSLPSFENDINKEIVIYSPEQVKTLLDTAKESDSHIFVFLLLALYTGLRRGELLALTWNDIDFKNKQLRVTKSRTGTYRNVTQLVTTPKTKSSNRVIPLTDNVIEELLQEKKRQEEYKQLFGNAYDKNHNFVVRNKIGKPYTNLNAILRVVDRIEKKAGLPHCTIHGLRHTVASILDDNGVPLQEISKLLGHESVTTTERIYIQRNRKAQRESIEILNTLYEN